MFNLKRAIIPGVAGITIGALLVGVAWSSGGGRSGVALAAPGQVNPSATVSRSTSMTIVNMGDAPTRATVKFFNSGGGSELNWAPGEDLGVGKSFTLDQRPEVTDLLPPQFRMPVDTFSGSAVAEASQRLAGTVNEWSADGGFDTYPAVAQDETSPTATCPLVFRKFGAANTIIHVQNAGSTAGSFKAEFYDYFTGQLVPLSGLDNLQINRSESKPLVLETDPLFNNLRSTESGQSKDFFIGSVVVSSSNTQLAVAAEKYDTGKLGNYTCFGAGANTAVVAQAYRIGQAPGTNRSSGTSITVANLGSATADVNFEYRTDNPANNRQWTDQVGSRTMKFYDQRFDMQNGGNQGRVTIPQDTAGQVVISSTQPIAVIVEQFNLPETTNSFFRGVSNQQLATTIVLPTIYSNVGEMSTSFQVVNPNNDSAQVTLSYVNAGGDAPVVTTREVTIEGKSSRNFEQRPDIPDFAADLRTFVAPEGKASLGSVTITSNRPVAAIVNQLPKFARADDPSLKDSYSSYNGFRK